MKAVELFRRRIVYSEGSFAELVLWRVPKPLAGSNHAFKYRLAYVVDGECVLRFDNETGKGDHRHFGSKEVPLHLLHAREADRRLSARHSEVE